MAFSVAALVAGGPTTIKDIACVDISFPDFLETLHAWQGKAELEASARIGQNRTICRRGAAHRDIMSYQG